MSRWIDADKLEVDIRQEMRSSLGIALGVSLIQINNEPSIDIVRCRECKHWERLLYDAPKEGWCNKHRAWFDADDFCSYGCREE